jgi:hypothetical protein
VELRFVLPDLVAIDRLKTESLAFAFFEDERPLSGTLGLVDWRLAGQISKALASGFLTGRAGERALLATRPRLTFDRLFLFGLGPSEDFTIERYRAAVRDMFDAFERAEQRAVVLGLPGREHGLIDAEGAARALFSEVGLPTPCDDLTLVEPAESHVAIDRVFRRERLRLGTDLPP